MPNDRVCPACGGREHVFYGRYRDEEYFTSDDEFDYWQCTACRTVFLHPLPLARLGEIYPPNYYSFEPGGFSVVQWVKQRLDASFFRRILRSIPGDKLSALDVGGGTGWLLDVIRGLDGRVDLTQVVDLDPHAGDAARAAGHAYACTRIEEFTSDRRFDLVLLLNLIEHVEGPRSVLEKVAALLSANGVVLVKTPNVDAADARVFRATYWGGLHVPRHWTLFTRDSFERMLAGTGLETKEFSYTQGAPFWAASTLAAWRRRGWIELSRKRPAPYHPLMGPLGAVFAAWDFARAPLAATSQMFFLLGRARS